MDQGDERRSFRSAVTVLTEAGRVGLEPTKKVLSWKMMAKLGPT